MTTPLDRRLTKLEATNDPGLSLADSLNQAARRHDERQRAWSVAGNEGLPPLGPISAPPSSSRHRDLWRKIAEGRARVIHIGHEADGTSPFASLQAVYALSDPDLANAINAHPSGAVWP